MKSTCSPIWATSEKTTAAAAPKTRILNDPSAGPDWPGKRVQLSIEAMPLAPMNTNGSRCSTTQNGWVQS